ncbi:MAG: PhoH family protein [Bacteroidetes bacterium]|nr:PhoH family protein [Bacteroidota bacterium]
MIEVNIPLGAIKPVEFYGIHNSRLGIIKKTFPYLNIAARGSELKVRGNEKEIEDFRVKIEQVVTHLEDYGSISDANLQSLLFGLKPNELTDTQHLPEDVIVHGPNGLMVKARTPNQKVMVHLAQDHDIVFAIGPAGTGKTYTAVALAVKALKEKSVKRIILTRPAVEAGENLGFLPGDLKDKIDPYLRPLYDALDDMIPVEKLNLFMTNRIIEIAPIAFMRGRTLDHAFIILDEAQNATDAQLKMFLTRLGPSAKCIITGDLTQIDLPRNQSSGLFTSLRILKEIDGIGTVFLNENDVVRHRLVKQIIKAYDYEKRRQDDVHDNDHSS